MPQLSRRRSRHAITLSCSVVSVRSPQPEVMRGLDLSPDGVWIVHPRPLPLGTEVVVTFKLNERTIAAVGEVRRHVAGGEHEGMGIAFTGITERDQRYIRDALRRRPPVLIRRRARGVHRELATAFLVTEDREQLEEQEIVTTRFEGTRVTLERELGPA